MGSFDEALAHGTECGKWLFINIQKEDEFECHTLNRDIWRVPKVLEMIEKYFVLYQIDSCTTYAQKYQRLYPFSKFPHLAIIDPRTGEQVYYILY